MWGGGAAQENLGDANKAKVDPETLRRTQRQAGAAARKTDTEHKRGAIHSARFLENRHIGVTKIQRPGAKAQARDKEPAACGFLEMRFGN